MEAARRNIRKAQARGQPEGRGRQRPGTLGRGRLPDRGAAERGICQLPDPGRRPSRPHPARGRASAERFLGHSLMADQQVGCSHTGRPVGGGYTRRPERAASARVRPGSRCRGSVQGPAAAERPGAEQTYTTPSAGPNPEHQEGTGGPPPEVAPPGVTRSGPQAQSSPLAGDFLSLLIPLRRRLVSRRRRSGAAVGDDLRRRFGSSAALRTRSTRI